MNQLFTENLNRWAWGILNQVVGLQPGLGSLSLHWSHTWSGFNTVTDHHFKVELLDTKLAKIRTYSRFSNFFHTMIRGEAFSHWRTWFLSFPSQTKDHIQLPDLLLISVAPWNWTKLWIFKYKIDLRRSFLADVQIFTWVQSENAELKSPTLIHKGGYKSTTQQLLYWH